jgi:hypothetical protein
MGLTFEISTAFGWVGIILVLSVGLIMMIFRPYWAFLFGVFILAATSINVSVMRTEELGAYFQMTDACIVVMIMASLLEKKRALLLPAPFVILTAVLLMGFLNTLLHLGLTYGMLQGLRWAIFLPLLIFLAANVLQDERKVRSLLLTLVLAAIVAEAQHLLLVLFTARNVMAEDVGVARTMQFMRSGSDLWLLAGFYVVGGLIPRRRVQTAIGALFLAGILTMQTRSIGLAFMGALGFYYFWFLKGPHAYRWQRFKGLVPIFIVGLIILAVIGLSAVITGYGERYVGTVETGEGTQSRWNAFYVEMHDWLDGNILIGRGLHYLESSKVRGGLIRKTKIGYGHLGYVTYLSQLGLIGFVVYGFWMPLIIIFRAQRLLQQPQAPPEVVHLAALTGATFFYYPLMFVFSGSFLNILFIPGILAGGVWGITSLQSADSRAPALQPPVPHKELPKSIISEPFQGTGRGRPLL